jgi:hypothetical protein
VHQPCTKPVQITCYNNVSKQPISSILSTKSYLLTKINHQYNSQRCASNKHNTTTQNHHQDQYVFLIIQVCYIIHKPCVNSITNKCLQPCTKYVPIMYQLLINYDSSICTNITSYTPHVCANSSTTCLNHMPNIYLIQNPSSISSSKYDYNSIIDLVYMNTYLQTFLTFNNKRLSFSSNVSLVSHD